MLDASSESERNPVERLAEEFAARLRRGDRPSVAQYLADYPEWAAEIADVFPALLLMEGLKPGPSEWVESRDDVADAFGAMPERMGDYRVLRRVGEGGMGIVYEAIRESLRSRVALKVLHPRYRNDPLYLDRFRNEARAAAGLHHPHIVPVFDFGVHDGECFYVMQFIPGQGLDKVIKEVKSLRAAGDEREATATISLAGRAARGLVTGHFGPSTLSNGPDCDGVSGPATRPIGARPTATDRTEADPCATAFLEADQPRPAADPSTDAGRPDESSGVLSGRRGTQYHREAARITLQVAEALAYAHRQSIHHRDIKPSNLLLDPLGNAWVTDFGLVKFADGEDLSRSGNIAGTLRYMAPERFDGWSDRRSDIYGLGATLYELLTLRPAFDARDEPALIRQVVEGSPEAPRALDRSIPRDLETIVLTSMAREAGDRYATADELAVDLRLFLAGRPILRRRAGVAERAWRWCRREPTLAMTGGLAVAALAGVAGLGIAIAIERSWANDNLRDEQSQTKDALNEARGQRDRSRKLASDLALSQGISLGERGEGDRALLWLARALELSPEESEATQFTIRANLTAWRRQVGPLKGILTLPERFVGARISSDGKFIVIASGTTAWLQAADGSSRGKPLKHQDTITAVAISPDGRTILTGTQGGTARLWDAVDGSEVGSPMRLGSHIYAVAFSPDARTIVTCSSDDNHTARLWRASDGAWIASTATHGEPIKAVAFSPDGRSILTGDHRGIARLWSTSDGAPIGVPMTHPDVVQAQFALPVGTKTPVGVARRSARVWRSSEGSSFSMSEEYRNSIGAVAFSLDGRTIVTGSFNGTAQLWDATEGTRIGISMPHWSAVTAAAFTPDGRFLITGTRDGDTRYWRAGDGVPVTNPRVHLGANGLVACSPEGKAVLDLTNFKTARLWAAEADTDGGPIMVHPSGIDAVAFSRDGDSVRTASIEGNVQAWRVEDGRLIGGLVEYKGKIAPDSLSDHIAFGRDGDVIVSTSTQDHTARLWRAADGTPIGFPMPHDDHIHCLAVSEDGKTILTGTSMGVACLWSGADGSPIGGPMNAVIGKPVFGHDLVCSAAFSPDGKVAVTGATRRQTDNFLERGGIARLWKTADGSAIGSPMLQASDVRVVAFSPDGKVVLTGTRDGSARLWDASDGRPISPPLKHVGSVQFAAFSPDGKAFLVGSGRAVRLWNAADWTPIGEPLMHDSPVRAASFGRDGKILLTGTRDGAARFWSAADARPIGPSLLNPGGVELLTFSPEGKKALTANQVGGARLWRSPVAMAGEARRVALWAQVVTGMELDESDAIRLLDEETWRARRRLLDELGGPPHPLDRTHDPEVVPQWRDEPPNPSSKPVEVKGRPLADVEPRGNADKTVVAPFAGPKRGPAEALARYRVGLALQARGDLDGAISAFGEAAHLDGDHVGAAVTARAEALLLARRDVEAIEAFDAILRRKPEESLAHRGLVIALRLAGRPEAAVKGHREAASVDPGAASGYWVLGNALRESGRLDAAIIPYEEAVRLDGAHEGAALQALGDALAQAGRYGEAISTHLELVRSRPEEPARRYHLALVMLMAGDRLGHRDSCTEAIRRLGASQDAAIGLVARACLLAPDGLDDQELPMRLAEMAVAIDPKAASWRALRGLAHYRAGHPDRAIADSLESIRLGPEGTGVASNWPVLALAHHQLGHDDEARRCLDRAHGREGDEARGMAPGAVVDAKEPWQVRADFMILLREADEKVLAPEFPADPFQK